MSPFTFRECEDSDLESIRALFNHAILNTTALYEYEPRSPERMTAWLAAKREGGWPVLCALASDGRLAGFSSYGPFRPQPGFSRTVEHSVYVDQDFQGKGLGRDLLLKALGRAKTEGFHSSIGALDADNTASIRLHESLGFTLRGSLPESGWKFNRWLTLLLYQKNL